MSAATQGALVGMFVVVSRKLYSLFGLHQTRISAYTSLLVCALCNKTKVRS